jgi:hypothetical protein
MEEPGMVALEDSPNAPATRRDRELASLYATARSLTALAELDEVLDSIVRHAHDLTGTDFTYLSLLSPEGDLRLRASQGTISAAFRAARMPRGHGLGGQVIGLRTPVWVRNYMDAAGLEHSSTFDGLVDDEGMVALLGVPLLVRGEAIGALFAADRTERSFRAEEIALLTAFADHAATAIDNARLYAASRTALQDLQRAYRTIEDQVATMERAQLVHEALTQVVLTGGGPQDVAHQLAGQLGGTVTVLDRDSVALTPRATPGGEETTDDSVGGGTALPAQSALLHALEAARRTGRCATVNDGGASHSVATIQADGSFLGALVWRRSEPPDAMEIRTLERATHVMGLLILKENAVADAAERLSGELLTDLLVASPGIGATDRARTRARGIDVDAIDVVLVAEATTVTTSEITRRLHVVAQTMNGLAGEHLGRATMLLHGPENAEVVADVHRQLRGLLGRPVTVIGERVQGTDFTRAFHLASRCSSLARALGRSDTHAMTDDFALYAMLFDVDRNADLDRFITSTIGPLVAYDARRNTDLVSTLSAYFANGGNLAGTARSMHVHLNTLLKRLDRVDLLLGLEVRTGHHLQLQVAIEMHRLRESMDQRRAD